MIVFRPADGQSPAIRNDNLQFSVANNTMSEKRHRNRKQFKKVKPDLDSLIESDEHFGFIAGYTSNGVPYVLTHEEWDEINSETKKEKTDNNNTDLPF